MASFKHPRRNDTRQTSVRGSALAPLPHCRAGERLCGLAKHHKSFNGETGGMTSALRVELYIKSSNRLLLRLMHLRIVSQVQVRDYSLVLCTTGRRTVMRGPVLRERRAPPTNGERPEIMRNGGWKIVQSHEIGQKLESKARPGHAASEHRGDPHTKA